MADSNKNGNISRGSVLGTDDRGNGLNTVDPFQRRDSILRTPPKDCGTPTEADAFARRDSIKRSPPRSRTLSMPEILAKDPQDEDHPSERKHKRRRKVSTPEKTSKMYVNNAKDLKDILEVVISQTSSLQKVLSGTYRPKNELCDVASNLALQVEKLRDKDLREWINQLTFEEKDNDVLEGLVTENEKLRRQIRSMESEQVRLHEEQESIADEKCEQCTEKRRLLLRRMQVKKEENFECFQAVTEEDWQAGVFMRAQVKEGKIWEAPMDRAFILPCDTNIKSGHKWVDRVIEKYGGKNELRGQEKKVGEVATMLHSISFPDKDGNFSRSTRCLYYPILSDRVEEGERGDEMLFESLKTIKESVLMAKSSKIAIPDMEGICGLIISRMMEFLFTDTGVQIEIYKFSTNEMKQNNRRDQTSQKVKEDKKIADRPRVEKNKLEALRVQVKGISYADTLKKVKQAIDPKEIGVEIKGARSAKNGDLILTVQNGGEGVKTLIKELRAKIPELPTKMLSRKKIIHVKDMEESTTIDDIKQAVSELINVNHEDYEVRALRPAYGNRLNATLLMREGDANRLIQRRLMKIGWASCRILERKQETRCFRCWELGHEKAECKGPNRENLCLRCGKEGHKASGCQNEPFCVHCKQVGHQSSSVRGHKPKIGKETEVATAQNAPSTSTPT